MPFSRLVPIKNHNYFARLASGGTPSAIPPVALALLTIIRPNGLAWDIMVRWHYHNDKLIVLNPVTAKICGGLFLMGLLLHHRLKRRLPVVRRIKNCQLAALPKSWG